MVEGVLIKNTHNAQSDTIKTLASSHNYKIEVISKRDSHKMGGGGFEFTTILIHVESEIKKVLKSALKNINGSELAHGKINVHGTSEKKRSVF